MENDIQFASLQTLMGRLSKRNSSRLQSALHGSKRKLKWLVQGGNYRRNDSTLPRLLTSVYTSLLRCATASDVCNFARGLRTKQTGSCCQFPFCISGLSKRRWNSVPC